MSSTFESIYQSAAYRRTRDKPPNCVVCLWVWWEEEWEREREWGELIGVKRQREREAPLTRFTFPQFPRKPVGIEHGINDTPVHLYRVFYGLV